MDIHDIHTPVMKDRTLELLAPALDAEGAVVIDATLGMGGHSEAILELFPTVRLIGLDRDTAALAIARERLERFASRIHLVHCVYDEIAVAWQTTGLPAPRGILFDLGVSSLHLDDAERGFAYAQDAPLDMRMNTSDDNTAADILANYDEAHLRRIFETYGEEKLSARYARAIVTERRDRPILRSGHLVAVLQAATPAALSNAGHPAKRVFQALRIEVNEELEVLERAIPAALDILGLHGRIVVMSYQSLEDKIVKAAFARRCETLAPADLPVVPEHLLPQMRLVTRGAEKADEAERAQNPRSAPVRLRAAERMRDAA
jgi:16S rRNA (cytosine1402-N4)-methyltransferase